MNHYIVSCEYQGSRRHTVEVPVSAAEPILAAEAAERVAANNFGGKLSDWFAWKVEPDNE